MPLTDAVSMSPQAAHGPSAAAPKAKARSGVHAIPVLDTPLARAVSLGRPALLLGLLAARFGALVADPVATLRSALPVVAAVQVAYAVACLPAAGSQRAKTAKKAARPGEKRRGDAAGAGPISTALLSLALTTIATPAAFALFVLFGAPLLDHAAHTLLCAAHLALLGLFPVFYARGVDGDALVAVAGAAAPLDETFGALVGAVAGAWLGAVPIPLDWDRAWQRWPVTVVVGLYGGSLLCSWLAGAVFYGRRLGGCEQKQE